MFEPIKNPKAQAIIRWIIMALSILTFTLASVSVGLCSFVVCTGWCIEKMGVYTYYDYATSSCEQYPDYYDFGSGHKTARAFGGLLLSFTPIIMVANFVVILGCTRFAIWMKIRIMVLFAIICQAFTYFIFKDYGHTSLGVAGLIAAINLILLVALSVLTWLVPSRTNEEPVTPQPLEQPYTGKYRIPPPTPIVQPGPIYVE